MARGWEPEAAISIPADRTPSVRGARAITFRGETKSISAWAKDPRCVLSEAQIRVHVARFEGGSPVRPERAVVAVPRLSQGQVDLVVDHLWVALKAARSMSRKAPELYEENLGASYLGLCLAGAQFIEGDFPSFAFVVCWRTMATSYRALLSAPLPLDPAEMAS